MSFLISFLLFFGTWIIFSGLLDGFHLTLGILSCGLVSAIFTRVLFPGMDTPLGVIISRIPRFVGYFGWLFKEIVWANLHVFRLAMLPGGMALMSPELVRIKIKLKGDGARYLLANSITLTPGTVSVKISKDELLVHSISRKTTEGLESDMEMRIAKIFGETLSPV